MQKRTHTTQRAQTLAELGRAAERLLNEAPVYDDRATVLALHGELGAGKTAFVQQLASLLGVREHVTSPTFIIMKSYETNHEKFSTLVHIDAYRIEHESELPPLRLPEMFGAPHTLVCVEWAERLGDIIPSDAVHLTITLGEGDVRTLTYATS